MKDKIVELRASLKDLPIEEIKQKLGDLKKSELMRSIILNEKQYCSCTYERSQRNFWYSVVKPTLDKIGKGMESWMEETGGINGLEKGLELDALTPERIREIFADELKNYVDNNSYVEYAKNTFLWRIIRKKVDRYMDGIVNDVFAELEDKVEVQQLNMMEYVRQGEIAIPFDEIC